MEKSELIIAHGHKFITSMHKTTLEITKDEKMTSSGDCIIAVGSNKSVQDLSDEFKEALKKPYAEVKISIQIGNEKEIVKGKGHPKLSLAHQDDIVIRKSDFICERTLAIKANKSSADLPRRFVNKLKNPNQIVLITLTVTNIN